MTRLQKVEKVVDWDVMPTQFGFNYGPASVERLMSDDRLGTIIVVRGKHEAIEIRVTLGGYIRLYDKRKTFASERNIK
jgi:hypothetical protein